MKILVLGSGAREHAIILALRSEEAEHEIFAAPGNAGIGQDAQLVALDQNDPEEVAFEIVNVLVKRGLLPSAYSL